MDMMVIPGMLRDGKVILGAVDDLASIFWSSVYIIYHIYFVYHIMHIIYIWVCLKIVYP